MSKHATTRFTDGSLQAGSELLSEWSLAVASFHVRNTGEIFNEYMLILSVFVTGSFTPSIPQIAKDLDTTGSIVKSGFFVYHRKP